MRLNVSGRELFSVNTAQFWFEYYPEKHELLSAVSFASFTKIEEVCRSSSKTNFSGRFNQSPKSQKSFLASWSANSYVLLRQLKNKKCLYKRDSSAL